LAVDILKQVMQDKVNCCIFLVILNKINKDNCELSVIACKDKKFVKRDPEYI